MSGLSSIKTISNRFKNFILATAFVATQLFVPYIASGTAAAAAGDITVGTFEGQNSDLSWSPGNNTQFAEGDYVNYRFPITSSATNTSGKIYVNFSTCMFTNYFSLYGDTSPVTVVPGTETSAGGDWSQPLTISFPTATTTTVYFTLRISNTGGDCNGSSSHVSLDTKQQDKGDFGNIGSKDIPIPAVSIYYSPSLTLTKVVDSGTAKASDFYFTVSPAVNGQTEIHLPDTGTNTSSVTITDVNPDGTYVITEHGPSGYEFEGGSGTNCDVTNAQTGEMTATVTAGRPAINASCTFTNTRSSGTLVVKKDVINDNGGTKTYSDFSFSVDGATAQSFDADVTDTNGEDGTKTLTLPTGTYTITEPEANTMGYDTSYDNCASVTVTAGQTATCTITNNDKPATLTVTKVVVNDNGGTKHAQDFQFKVNNGAATNFESDGSNSLTLDAGTYSVTEVADNGYQTSYDNCSNIVLTNGSSATCTITNNDIAPTLTLLKTVNNGYGGDAKANDFPVYIGQTLSSWGSAHTEDAGSYIVSEDATAVSGYQASDWGGDCATDGSITLHVGDNKTCTITNSQLPGSINGYKYVVDANGSGTTPLKAWTIYLLVNGQTVTSTTTNDDGYYSFGNLDWGTYSLAECTTTDVCTGWSQIYRPSDTTTVDGSNLSSKDNNFGNFKNGSISGYKFNDLNGDGTKQEDEPKLANWPFSYVYDANNDGQFNETATNFSTDQNGNFTLPNLKPGKYQVCEDPQTALGWTRTTPSSSNCRTRTIDVSGEPATDLVFGNQARGTIQVLKKVDDGFGNVTTSTNWTWNYAGDNSYVPNPSDSEVAAGSSAVTVAADTYTISENQKDDYHFTSVSCTNNGDELKVDSAESFKLDIGAGDSVVCTFTNTRDTGYLKVVKDVVNNNSGNKTYADFHFTVNNGDPQSFDETVSPDGAKLVKVITGTYTVVEPEANSMGYTTSYHNCTNVEVTTANNIEEPAVCTITNDDVAHPGIKIVKSGPAVAHEGDTITFTGTITNTGDAPLDIVGVEDNVAGTVNIVYDSGYPVGDTNHNYLLDVDETWTATVDYVVPSNQTDDIVNTMTVCANDATGTEPTLFGLLFVDQTPQELTGDVCDSDNHITDVLHPAINVVKSGPNSAPAGTNVTYTFTVTNTGDTPLTMSSVNDSIAGAGVYQSGDTNNDGMLDLDETWVYTANYKIPANQIANVNNTVTVCAYDQLEEQVCNEDSHSLTIPKVLGATTELPNTGQNPLLFIVAGLSFISLAFAVRFGSKAKSTL